MPVQVNYLENGIGVEILVEGILEGNDLLNAKIEIYNSKQFHAQKYHIIDRSACTEYYLTADDILAVAELDKKASEINNSIMMV